MGQLAMLRRLLGKHSARFALVGCLFGAFFALIVSHRGRPAAEPSSASATAKRNAAPVVESARRFVDPAPPVADPDHTVLLPSAAPVASPAPPPRAPATAQEPASEPARLPQKPAPRATPTPEPAPHPAPKRTWNPFPELKQPVLPPNVR